MSLKDMMQDDLDHLFFNTDDFGEEHIVEGEPIVCIFDKDVMQARSAALGMAESFVFLEARCKDLPQRKESGNSLNVDGREYLIEDWSEEAGMATITLHQNRSG